MDHVSLKIIGRVATDFRQKFGTPRQGSLTPNSRARVELAPEWRGRGILDGLDGFSHVWLLTYLHLSDNTRTRGKVHPPRLRGAKIGILASRSPHRPNNVGLTLARIVEVAGDVLHVAEIDIVDGTPILDIKPYLAQADRPDEFKDGWTGQLGERVPCVTEFSDEAAAQLRELCAEPDRVRALIVEMLALDPRPPAYLDRRQARFAIWVAGLNVVMTFDENVFTVARVEKAESADPSSGRAPD